MSKTTKQSNTTSKGKDERAAYKGEHILAEGYVLPTDSWETGINNNVLIFGPSGAGKTRSYVKPNLINACRLRNESIIVSDTKGSLYGEMRKSLEDAGYEVLNLDFTDLRSGCGYNPMDYIRYDEEKGIYNEQDIMSIARCLVPDACGQDPYWDNAGRQFLSLLIAYTLEALPAEEHTLEYVVKLFNMMGTRALDMMVRELAALRPNSSLPERYEAAKSVAGSPKTEASIKGILATAMDNLTFSDARLMYSREQKIDLSAFGRRRIALFLTISDTDRSMDGIANAFMTQVLQVLCRSADKDYEEHRLDVPVRIYLDDFATNLFIPEFDNIISVIRSREIYVSVILQSITQLDARYGQPRARTIINNCDMQLYLGGQDIDTANLISVKANKSLPTILALPLDEGYLFLRGQTPKQVRKYSAQ